MTAKKSTKKRDARENYCCFVLSSYCFLTFSLSPSCYLANVLSRRHKSPVNEQFLLRVQRDTIVEVPVPVSALCLDSPY